MKIVALIMAGGRGERFWPASRNEKPKQFLCFTNENESMIQMTVKRILPLVSMDDIYILTNEAYKSLVHEQLPNIKEDHIILEPVSKNTAPAIELGIEAVKKTYSDVSVIVLPSDHLIADENEFRKVLSLAKGFAETRDSIVTIGINPTEPNTGYGYIQLGQGNDVKKVTRFAEKPALEIAKQYLKEGNYVWNAGMFIFTLKNMERALQRYLPKQYEILSKDISRFNEVESISIDYGVMERADNIYCVPGSFGWNDVGNWGALEEVYKKDSNGNCLLNKDTVTIDSEGVTIKGTNKKLIATMGLKNVVIVETEDAIMVINKDKLSDIKKIRTELIKDKLDKYL